MSITRKRARGAERPSCPIILNATLGLDRAGLLGNKALPHLGVARLLESKSANSDGYFDIRTYWLPSPKLHGSEATPRSECITPKFFTDQNAQPLDGPNWQTGRLRALERGGRTQRGFVSLALEELEEPLHHT